MLKNEEEIVRKAKDGDEKAFEIIVKTYQSKVANLIYKIIGDETIVEDLTQDVFVKVYESIKDYRLESALYTWIYRITVNICIDEIRRRRRGKFLRLEKYENKPSHPQIERNIEVEEIRKKVRDAVMKLPYEYRITIILKEFEDLSYEEIAKILGIRLGTVKSRIFRARELLAKYLKDYRGEIQ